MSITVPVALASHRYDIHIEAGLLNRAGERLKPVLKKPRVLVVTDRTVGALHLTRLVDSLTGAGITVMPPIAVTPGEESKSLANFEQLIDAMLARAMERGVTVIAFGGGVVGDLAGFAAATVLRGVDFVQIPATLLAQVDSSVGGKTGVNAKAGKNLIGAFHQPRMVLIDPELLDTLPKRELGAGYAEVIKYGLIDMPEFFEWCLSNGAAIIAGDRQARADAIAESCRAKARIVAGDEFENGARALLNLGHTFGHALEAEAGYDGRLLHGEGVAVGMVLACRLSASSGFCDPDLAMRLGRHFTALGIPARIADTVCAGVNGEQLLTHMFRDKKVKDGRLTFILTRGAGQAFIAGDIEPGAVRALLDAPEDAYT